MPVRWNPLAVRLAARLRSIRITARGVAMLSAGAASVVGAYWVGLPELLYLGAFTTALPLAAVTSVLLRRLELRVVRSFTPAVANVGRPTTVTLRISAERGMVVPRLSWSDPTPWGDPGGVLPRGHTGGDEGVTVSYLLTPPRRGLFGVGPLRVEVADPFGLCRAMLRVGEESPVLVLPVIEPLAVTALSAAVGEGRMSSVQRAPGGQDDLSTREYRTGDPLRRVHWGATARHGELMVRQEESVSHAEVRIVLDTRRRGYRDLSCLPDRPQSEAFERAVSVAISAALHFSRLGYAVDLVELGAGHLAPLTPTPAFLRSVATLELSDVDGGRGGGAPGKAVTRRAASGAVIAVLENADAEAMGRLALLRVGCSPAVAIVVGTASAFTTQNRLAAAGWDCVAMPPEATVEQVWQAAAARSRARNVS
ncbi:MAG: DUF58 domain-containing protein [Microbacteriaceae bacterium]|nr:DUF58 domain-containing protein [Microbacteriaceae bacterium]